MDDNLKMLRALTRHVLQSKAMHSWSMQGLGMLRLHMGDNMRLHVWNSQFAFPNASPIHDHMQWGLHSTIIAGKLINKRYEIVEGAEPTHNYTMLKCGYGCFFKHDPIPVHLKQISEEIYLPGDTYSQAPNEIHWSAPEDGTVTIMQKYPANDQETARVFWDIGKEWGSAEPREASIEEIDTICEHALEEWF